MVERQLSVRSAKAIEIAHRLARRSNNSVAHVVERALELLDARETGRESASSFYGRIASEYGTEIDLEEVIKEGRRSHGGIDL